MSEDVSCTNIFSEKNGYSVHFKLVAADMPHKDGESDLAALMAGTEIMLKWMKEHEYVHDTSKDRPRGGGGRAPQPPPTIQANGQTIEIKCGRCGGDVYDNTQRNKEKAAKGEKLMPAYKCKKGDACGWLLWTDKVDNYINELTEEGREKVEADFDASLPHE